MSLNLANPTIYFVIDLVLLVLVMWAIIAWTTRISFRLRKVEVPKSRFLFAVTLLQILVGGLTFYGFEVIKDGPALNMGIALGITILSGLLFRKMILKSNWKQTLGGWAIAALLQLVLLPVSLVIMLFVWVMLLFIIHPPQH
jgi:hypothetical protein